MSGNPEDEKHEAGKSYPLDLAPKLTTMKTVDGKAILPGQSFRSVRVLTNAGSQSSSAASTIISTNMVPQAAVIKQGQNQSQASGNLTISRQATSLPVVCQSAPAGTTYHVPRGAAVVANLSAPRSNVVAAIRAPLVVTAQNSAQNFVRPPRTPSPAQGGGTWLTNSSNGSQIKGTINSPIRAAAGKSQLVARPQVVSTIRPPTAILHSTIIGQGQLHTFKTSQGTPAIQTLNAVTLAQVLPSRTQTLVYSTGNTTHFAATPRITIATTVTTQRQQTTTAKPMVTATRLAVPVNVTQTTSRLVAPQAAMLSAAGTRISAVTATSQQPATVLGATPTRILSTTPTNVSLNRLTMAVTNPPTTSNNAVLNQIRSTLAYPIIAATNSSQNRTLPAQAKVITPNQGTAIHLTQIPPTLKSNIITTTARTISAQSATIVAQRPGSVVTSHPIPIAKVFPQQGDGQQQQVMPPTNLYIQGPVSSVPRRSSPGPTSLNQTSSSAPATTVATYSLAGGTYIYDTSSGNYSSVSRSFNPQQHTSFVISQPTNQQQQQRQNPVHAELVTNSMRFNSIILEQGRSSAFAQESSQDFQSLHTPTKVTSSPRPSILRKRDHDGSPMKAAKNLISALSNLQQQSPVSPLSRPDSRNNGHSSGGSTTISATSSPGLADGNDDSMPHVPMNKDEEENRPPLEMSPRKKPRKQNLTGNDLDENNDDMQFISERDMKKPDPDDSDGIMSDGPQDGAPEARRVTTVRKPASASLLNSYKQTWKSTHNHYLRHSDVRPKDERKPTIMDLANQHRVLDKVNGWKIHHLSTQMDDLAQQEHMVHNQLTELLKFSESRDQCSEINSITELIKGNLQRIKIINDGMIDAKTQIMKIFDHKTHVADIISRCASKRNYKKREKS
ncbi:PREDICTED: histone deacetylase complex subunit SAP130-A isoform X2 [Nicrophorus vespilloides]|uniref:Histone deacetylase complex subunit SAP130-A isoform X2 n=1 Tax=Nicrophorus vespilloides TaxID=110193 RepID=A0ABM1MEQ5_NICVS|nr:PREDICTED: histone deacetylase complex subunit SAP130-A isoform X2 [Nicrophorus vespilloides]